MVDIFVEKEEVKLYTKSTNVKRNAKDKASK